MSSEPFPRRCKKKRTHPRSPNQPTPKDIGTNKKGGSYTCASFHPSSFKYNLHFSRPPFWTYVLLKPWKGWLVNHTPTSWCLRQHQVTPWPTLELLACSDPVEFELMSRWKLGSMVRIINHLTNLFPTSWDIQVWDDGIFSTIHLYTTKIEHLCRKYGYQWTLNHQTLWPERFPVRLAKPKLDKKTAGSIRLMVQKSKTTTVWMYKTL